MRYTRIIIAVIFSIFSTGIMSYISMATPIGPWIETTLVLCGILLLSLKINSITLQEYNNTLGLITVAGGIGGILATAFGFSFPAIYFIDPILFNSWMDNIFYFSSIITSLALAAGSFGLAIAAVFQDRLLITQKMPFPIGELIHKTITVHGQLRKALQLATGFICTMLLLYIQKCTYFINSCLTLVNNYKFSVFTIPSIVLPVDQLPMYWAVGFITGHVIAVPLVIGFIIKLVILDPLYYIYTHSELAIHKLFFSYFADANITSIDFILAFCSGMVLYGTFISFLGLPSWFMKVIKNKKIEYSGLYDTNIPWAQVFAALMINIGFLTYWNFSLISQFYLLIFTVIWTYQMLVIAGKIGIAPLGRFATFVMIPGMLLFKFTAIQAILVATFVEVAGGVACDALFGRRMGLLTSINNKKIVLYQWLGLIVSACAVGIIFWLFIHNFGLGSGAGALSANKAASRALLINVKSFDFYVLLIGFIVGYIIRYTRVNPMLILGGILMPPGISLMLIAGGFSAYLVKDKEEYYPFWSGVFAADSLWMLAKALLKIPCF